MQPVQLSLLDQAPQTDNTFLIFNTSDPAKAKRLRLMADKMQKTIDAKKKSAISQQRPTRISHKLK